MPSTTVQGRRSGAMPYVWMYHSVTDHTVDPYDVTVSPTRLDQQLDWLRRRGRRGVSLAELLRADARGAAAGLVGLTFDDGYADFVTEVMPALARYGFGATAFVLAGRFGGSNEWDRPGPAKDLMTVEQVREIEAAGIEIGSHGLYHVRLSGVDDAELAAEVAHSRAALGEALGHDVAGFCYPYGDLSARVVDAVTDAGYTYAAAIHPCPQTGPHAVPRTFIGEQDEPLRLRAKELRHTMRWRGRTLT